MLENINNNNLFNDDFINALKDLSIDEKDLDGIYAYLAMFNDDLTTQEKAFWSVILEKFDPEYNDYDEEDNDTESGYL